MIVFTFHLSPLTLKAQQPWNYTSIEEAHLDDAYFVTPSAALKARIQKEIPQAIKQSNNQAIFNRFYRLSVEQHSGRNLLRFQSDSLDFTLPETLATEIFPYIVSSRYWQQRYRTLQQWAFVTMERR